MTNFYGELTKIILIVLTTPSKLLLIKQNAAWKAGAQNGQKKAKGQDQKTHQKSKNNKEDDTSVSSEDHDTNTSRASKKTTKMHPRKSNIILPHLNLILLEKRMMEAVMMNRNHKNHPTKQHRNLPV